MTKKILLCVVLLFCCSVVLLLNVVSVFAATRDWHCCCNAQGDCGEQNKATVHGHSNSFDYCAATWDVECVQQSDQSHAKEDKTK